MYRGETTFVCPKCGKCFKGPDFELAATIFTVPQPCPCCGTESPAIKDRPISSSFHGLKRFLGLGGKK